MLWLNPGVEPPPTLASPAKRDRYASIAAFASTFATPTDMGDHEFLEAGEALVGEELKWKLLEWAHRAGGK